MFSSYVFDYFLIKFDFQHKFQKDDVWSNHQILMLGILP